MATKTGPSTDTIADDDGIRINAQTLEQLKTYFDAAGESGMKGLFEDEFVSLLADVLKVKETAGRQELTHLFMKIDANSDGTVDWDEFTSYLVMESQANDIPDRNFDKFVSSPVSEPADNHLHYHRDMIEDILYIPKSDKYLTASRDGTFKVWGCKDRSHYRTVRCGRSWIIGSCVLPKSNRVAMVNADQTIHFFDANSFELVSRFNDDPSTRNNDLTVEEMRSGVRPHHIRSVLDHMPDMMAIGDSQGTITLVSFHDKWHACDGLLSTCSHESPKCNAVRYHHLNQIHSDWITDIKWVPELDALITSSLDRTVIFTDIEKRSDLVRKRYTGHNKGVYSFDYCPGYKLMISCGSSRRISVWDPFRCREVNSLSGHTAAVQQVLSNEDANQIISLAVDKTIKIWDIRNFRCMQTITDHRNYRPENRISKMAFIAQHKTLLVGSSRLLSYPSLATCDREPHSHDDDICDIVYNSPFRQLVSADLAGQVKVWDIVTGRLVSSFRQPHSRAKLTAMAFDASMRRLLTGTDDGSVKVWNFSSGQCLSTCSGSGGSSSSSSAADKREVTSISFLVDQRFDDSALKSIISCGWDGRVRIWADTGQSVLAPDSIIYGGSKGHQGDVTCCRPCTNSWLATGGRDGCVVIWSLESKAVKKKVYAGESVEALLWSGEFRVLISTGADGHIRAYDGGKDWAELWLIQNKGDSISDMAKDDGDQMIITGHGNGDIKIWRTDNLREIRPILCRSWRGHDKSIISIDIVNEYRMIVSGSDDRRILLWSMDGALIGMFANDRDPWDLFSPSSWQSPAKAPDPVQFLSVSSNDENGDGSKDYRAKGGSRTDRGNIDDNDYWMRLKAITLSSSHQSNDNRHVKSLNDQIWKRPKPQGDIISSKLIPSPAVQSSVQYRIHSRLPLAAVEDVPLCGNIGGGGKAVKNGGGIGGGGGGSLNGPGNSPGPTQQRPKKRI